MRAKVRYFFLSTLRVFARESSDCARGRGFPRGGGGAGTISSLLSRDFDEIVFFPIPSPPPFHFVPCLFSPLGGRYAITRPHRDWNRENAGAGEGERMLHSSPSRTRDSRRLRSPLADSVSSTLPLSLPRPLPFFSFPPAARLVFELLSWPSEAVWKNGAVFAPPAGFSFLPSSRDDDDVDR